MKPADWPRYMLAKPLRNRTVAYYWNPSKRDLAAGCPLPPEALGSDYGIAIARANLLNEHLDDWRQGSALSRTDPRDIANSFDWFVKIFLGSARFAKVSARTKPGYRRALLALADMHTNEPKPRRVGELPISSFTPRAIDRIYERRLKGIKDQDGVRIRQANKEMDVLRLAWKVVHRLHPKIVPKQNPCIDMDRLTSSGTAVAATREEAYALARALKNAGHPHLGAAALICFEWHQRPEHVITGWFTWADYRPSERPKFVRIRHPKTKTVVWMPLEDQGTRLFPDIEAYLQELPKLGVTVVLTPGLKGAPRPYSQTYAQHTVANARSAAGLPDYLTLDSCRHGGMTELGNAEVTEQGIMSLSGHKTPAAARLYVKRTETQRLAAAKRRREWVESNR